MKCLGGISCDAVTIINVLITIVSTLGWKHNAGHIRPSVCRNLPTTGSFAVRLPTIEYEKYQTQKV